MPAAGICHKSWIIDRFDELPESKKREVADHYDHIVLSERNNRQRYKKANNYLLNVAREYRAVSYKKGVSNET